MIQIFTKRGLAAAFAVAAFAGLNVPAHAQPTLQSILAEIKAAPAYEALLRKEMRGIQIKFIENVPQNPDIARRLRNTIPRDNVSALEDVSLRPEGDDKTCYIFSVTRPGNLIGALQKPIPFPIEQTERFSDMDIALWALFHELAHCRQKVTPTPQKELEAKADLDALRWIKKINPKSNIENLVIAYRMTGRWNYGSGLILHRKFHGMSKPSESANINFAMGARAAEPLVRTDLTKRFGGQTDVMMFQLAVLYQLKQKPETRAWATLHLQSIKYLAPTAAALAFEKLAAPVAKMH